MSTAKTKHLKEVLQAIPQTLAAWLLSVQPRTMRTATWKDAPRNPDGSYDARELVEWRLERQAETDDVDPLLAGSDSPALERFRNARADRKELELAARRQQLIDVDEFLAWWDSEIAAPIHKSLEKLQRKYGKEAAELVTASLNHATEVIAKRHNAK